jgi:hypothetical protein
MLYANSSWPSKLRISCPLATSNNLIVLSLEAEANVLPLGLNDRNSESDLCAASFANCVPLCASHKLIEPSEPPVANNLPSWLHANARTPFSCGSLSNSLPVSTSHTLAAPGCDAASKRLPSGLKATAINCVPFTSSNVRSN